MSGIIRIAGIGLGGGMLALLLRRERPELAAMTALAASAVILASIIGDIKNIINGLRRMTEMGGIDMKYFVVCIKAAGTAYAAEFSSQLLRDAGEGAIASKVEAAGRIAILVMTLPILEGLMEMCIRAVNSV
ncbi:MAG: stage III sporulation protein AD [Clostridia bacterium]|nr:stage III sporulation protein AD [Clostridia bacterium]